MHTPIPVQAVDLLTLAVAETPDGGTSELPGLPPLAQYGLLGVFILAAGMRKVVWGWQFDRLEKENAELKQENRDLVQLNFETQQKVLPALELSSRALTDVSYLLETRRRELRDREREDDERR